MLALLLSNYHSGTLRHFSNFVNKTFLRWQSNIITFPKATQMKILLSIDLIPSIDKGGIQIPQIKKQNILVPVISHQASFWMDRNPLWLGFMLTVSAVIGIFTKHQCAFYFLKFPSTPFVSCLQALLELILSNPPHAPPHSPPQKNTFVYNNAICHFHEEPVWWDSDDWQLWYISLSIAGGVYTSLGEKSISNADLYHTNSGVNK